jgi:hypothetical protein
MPRLFSITRSTRRLIPRSPAAEALFRVRIFVLVCSGNRRFGLVTGATNYPGMVWSGLWFRAWIKVDLFQGVLRSGVLHYHSFKLKEYVPMKIGSSSVDVHHNVWSSSYQE